MNLIKIHYCGYASQPYVDIYCTGKTHYVNGFSNIQQVYMADGDETDHSPVYYTFDWRLVTCDSCLTKKAL
jgi:hypothetical protein